MTEPIDAVDTLAGWWPGGRRVGANHLVATDALRNLALSAGLSGDGRLVLHFTTNKDGTQGVDVVGVLEVAAGTDPSAPFYRIVEPGT